MLRFHDHEDFFELDLLSTETDPTPAFGDAYVSVSVRSADFTGQNQVWVHQATFAAFCHDLRQLVEKRQGSAMIDGLSPGELSITVRSVDQAGHMIVEGTIGYHVYRSVEAPWHSITFGIEFDPSQLNEVERIPWVKQP